ncbi:MAG: ATP-binding protein [Longimicrobiales bacterium]
MPATCVETHDHAVQFYESDDFLCNSVAQFLAEGLAAAEPLILIATDEHTAGIRARLLDHGYDLDRVQSTGQLMHMDARETLALFMREGMPDAQLFASTVGRVVGERLQAHRSRTVRAYGEMVNVLWAEGNAAGAIRLEELWNELGEQHTFSLLCAYAMANFYRVNDAEYFDRICSQHSRVIPTERSELVTADAAAREISQLQQRMVALESALGQAREEVERAQRVKSDFLAVMSHELRTPLNAILGYDELLEQEVSGPTTETQKVYIGRIRDGAEDLMQLIDQVLSLARIEAGDHEILLEMTNVADVVTDAVTRMEPAAAARRLQIEAVVPAERVKCFTDTGKLRQILLNLLSNAVKFTMRGAITVNLNATEDAITISVCDTGPGIGALDQDRIFEPFVQLDASATRRFGGTGAGLSVSRDFARLLGGDVTVASERDVGSIFTLCLPTRAFPYLHSNTV